MRNFLAVTAVTVFTTATLTAALWADTVDGLSVSQPMLRATAPGAPVAGGYLVITNPTEADDLLVAATIDLDTVGRVELHEMTMADGVMMMSEVEGGIPVPAGETVVLQPGGLHLMLMGLTGPLEAGATHEVTLTFEQAGEMSVTAPVATLGDIRAAFEGMGGMDAGHGHGDHGHGHGHKHEHSGHGKHEGH
ncbi:hypothetical protein JANAI62_01200 [Jannaschia pagri]|uniref:Copper(I)-binding protein n=1 Tax=Jannaschia pagri TaxID=2829797 RepID=A0ABQ4NGF8_9RHOB|nr:MULTISPECIES: copper chaperone PCu(A)C [unclassified Jannaschia]GIT90398.1 hypothetical protein JANAI61_08560 [Jannaschia sp. AI_61]GIT93497.1 hypothetical protein JANAI62_01200 [Jannaschia sp. AI_62]